VAINRISDIGYYADEYAEEIDLLWSFAAQDSVTHGALATALTTDMLERWVEGNFEDLVLPEGLNVNLRNTFRRVKGWDVRLAAPKDFSVLWSMAPDEETAEQLELLQRIGAYSASSYLARHAVVGRKTKNKVTVPIPLSPLIAGVHHSTNRNNEPHLHSHCLVFGTAYDPESNRMRAIHSPWLYRHYKVALALHRATIRHELHRLYPSTRFYQDQDGQWRIAQVDPDLIAELSTRSLGVRLFLEYKMPNEDLDLLKRTQPHVYYDLVQEAVFATRFEKTAYVPASDHRHWWRDIARQFVDSLTEWWETFRSEPVKPTPTLSDQELIEKALAKVTEHSATWTKEDLMVAVCDISPTGIASVADLERLTEEAITSLDVVPLTLLDQTGSVIRHDVHEIPAQLKPAVTVAGADTSRLRVRYTTTTLLEQERVVLNWAATDRSPATTLKQHQLKPVLETYSYLSDEQSHAVQVMTTSEKACVIVRGAPGAGKTSMLKAAAKAWRDAGIDVYAVGFTGRAASELMQAAPDASTIHRFLAKAKNGGLPNHPFVVICDEASMVSTDLLYELATLVNNKNGRLVLIGDHRQLPSVSAGGLFSHMWLHSPRHNDDFEDGRAELRGNLRQVSTVMKEIVRSLERNDVEGALRLVQMNDDLVIGDDDELVMRKVARDWVDATLRGEDTALLAMRNDDVARLNLLARSILLEKWKNGTPSSIAPLGKVLKTGLSASKSHPSVGYREYRQHERIICLDNARLSVNGKRYEVRNSWSGTVISKTPHGLAVRFDHDNEVRVLPFTYLEESTDYGYARTVYKAQGVTVGSRETHGTVFLFRPEILEAKAAWVAATRATHQLKLYVSKATKVETYSSTSDLKGTKKNEDADETWKRIEFDLYKEDEDEKKRWDEDEITQEEIVEDGVELDHRFEITISNNEADLIEKTNEVIREISERWKVGTEFASASSAIWKQRLARRVAITHTIYELQDEVEATNTLIEQLPSLLSTFVVDESLRPDPQVNTLVNFLAQDLDDVLSTQRSHVPLTHAIVGLITKVDLTPQERYAMLVNGLTDTATHSNAKVIMAQLRLLKDLDTSEFESQINTLKHLLTKHLVDKVRQEPDYAIQLAERAHVFETAITLRHDFETVTSPERRNLFQMLDLDVETYDHSVERELKQAEQKLLLNVTEEELIEIEDDIVEDYFETDYNFSLNDPGFEPVSAPQPYIPRVKVTPIDPFAPMPRMTSEERQQAEEQLESYLEASNERHAKELMDRHIRSKRTNSIEQTVEQTTDVTETPAPDVTVTETPAPDVTPYQYREPEPAPDDDIDFFPGFGI